MEAELDDRTYAAVGRAVFAGQLFEAAFAMTARLALKQPEARVLDDIVRVDLRKAAKQAVVALIKELRGSSSIDETLATRTVCLAETRHRLIHRLFLDGAWPKAGDSKTREGLLSLCSTVITESVALALEYLEILVAWLNRVPGLSALANEHGPAIRGLAERLARAPKSP